MKQIILTVFIALVLASCGGWLDQVKTSESEQTTSWKNPFVALKDTYLDNQEFLECAQESVDQCIISTFSSKDNFSIDVCDDLILKSNRDTCEKWIITSQARESWEISQCDQLSDPSGCRYEILVAKWISDKTVDACDTVSQELKIQCNNTVAQSLSYETLDTQWCDKILVEIEGDDLDIIKQNCIRDIEQAKEIEAEVAQQQAEEEERIKAEQAEQELQQVSEVNQQDQENDITEESVDPASNEVNENSNEVVEEELSTNE